MIRVPIDYNGLFFWLSVTQWGFNVIVMIYLWISRKYQATNTRLKRTEQYLGERIDTNERDIIKVQTTLEHLPSQQQFSGLGADIRTLTSKLGNVEGRLEGINRVADLMNQFLINQGGRRSEDQPAPNRPANPENNQ